MQKRKGFTLVELVIVIAVIAILAGVLIGTFASVINRANDSANIQKTKSDEIAQKAEDIIKKIEDSNWYGWEDYEADIVKKIVEEVDKINNGQKAEVIKEVVEDVVKTALASAKAEATGVTADQVRAIIENSVGTLQYEGPTEAQVRAAVSAKSELGEQLTATDVKEIIAAANEKNLTAADLALAVATINFTQYQTTQAAVEAIKAEIRKGNKFLSEDLTATIKEAIDSKFDELKGLINGTDTDPIVLAKAYNIRIRRADATTLNTVYDVLHLLGADTREDLELAYSAVNPIFFNLEKHTFFVYDNEPGRCFNVPEDFDGNNGNNRYKYWVFKNTVDPTYSTYLLATNETSVSTTTGLDVGRNAISTVTYTNTSDSDKTVVIRTCGGRLIVGAEGEGNEAKGTIIHYGVLDVATVYTTNNSFHTHGAIGKMELRAGKAVAEQNGIIYLAEAKAAGVQVVENGGRFVIPSGVSTTDVPSSVAATIGYTVDSNATNYDNATVSSDKAYEIGSLEALESFRDLVNGGFNFKGLTVKLTADITLKDGWIPIGEGSRDVNAGNYEGSYQKEKDGVGASFSGIFDGNNKTISNLNNKDYVPSLFSPDGDYLAFVYGFFGILNNAEVKDIIFKDVNIDFTGDTNVPTATTTQKIARADSVGALAGYSAGNLKISGITVNGQIIALDAVSGVLGRAYNKSVTNPSIVISGCTNNATVRANGEKAAGILGFANKKVSTNDYTIEISGNTNNGNIYSTMYASGISIVQAFTNLTFSNNVNNGDIHTSGYAGQSEPRTTVGVSGVAMIISGGNQEFSATGNSNHGKAYIANVELEGVHVVCRSYSNTKFGEEKNK